MNEEAQNALAELERMKQEMAAKLAAVSQMMAQMKPAPQTTDAPKPDEKPDEPAPAKPAAEPEHTAPAPEAQNAPQTDNKTAPEIKTLQDFADWLNESGDTPSNWMEVAESHGWRVYDDENERDYCTDGEDKVTILDSGEVAIRPLTNDERGDISLDTALQRNLPSVFGGEEKTAEKPDGENTPPDPAEPEDNKDGEDKTDEKPADKPEEEKPPKWEWKATNHMEERLKAYFDKNASPELRAKIEGKKTLQGAANHLYEWAQKKAEKGARGYFAEDEDVFCELMHYFEEDSLNCEWKPTPKPKPYTPPSGNYKPPVIPKPAPKKPDPQMTLFDF